MTVRTVFRQCVEAIRQGVLIERVSATDKEFHFQNWFKKRLEGTGLHFEGGGRNSYPDFRLVQFTDGYELKGLAYPGRDATFDSNSQVPTGFHNGRTIYIPLRTLPEEARRHHLPRAEVEPGGGFVQVGELRRVEAAALIVGYSFNLQTNEIAPEMVANPGARREHGFRAWRLQGSPADHVSTRALDPKQLELEAEDEDADE